jgi:isopenicillin N synthase-like dioxygenase
MPPSQRTVSGTDGGQMTEARYSIPYFVAPDPESVIECLPACVGPGRPPKYPPITQEEYASMRGRLQYSEKPDVASPGQGLAD